MRNDSGGGGDLGGAAAPQLQNLDKDFNGCFLPPLLIWQCDVIIDDMGRNMIKNDENDKTKNNKNCSKNLSDSNEKCEIKMMDWAGDAKSLIIIQTNWQQQQQ